MKFYLAGPFRPIEKNGKQYSDWREYIKAKVKNHKFIDPRNNNQSCPATFTNQDMESVINSEGVFLYRPNIGEIIGGAWEHGIACGATKCGKKIPTIYVDEKSFPFPILTASAKRTFTNLDAAVIYLNFLKSWDKEFEAIYKYLDWENSASKQK